MGRKPGPFWHCTAANSFGPSASEEDASQANRDYREGLVRFGCCHCHPLKNKWLQKRCLSCKTGTWYWTRPWIVNSPQFSWLFSQMFRSLWILSGIISTLPAWGHVAIKFNHKQNKLHLFWESVADAILVLGWNWVSVCKPYRPVVTHWCLLKRCIILAKRKQMLQLLPHSRGNTEWCLCACVLFSESDCIKEQKKKREEHIKSDG